MSTSWEESIFIDEIALPHLKQIDDEQLFWLAEQATTQPQEESSLDGLFASAIQNGTHRYIFQCLLDGETQQQIAERLGVGTGTVSSAWSESLKKIKKILKEELSKHLEENPIHNWNQIQSAARDFAISRLLENRDIQSYTTPLDTPQRQIDLNYEGWEGDDLEAFL